MGKKIDMIGLRFGRLIVQNDTGKRSNSKKIIYRCACDCGNFAEVEAGSLRNGDTKSCGCLKTEKITKHKGSGTKLYRIWADMLSRCRSNTCTNYKNYGARGIKVCDEWLSFKNFQDWALMNGYQRGLTIDRKDVNGNYEPSNCQWATRKQQDRNRRKTLYASVGGIKKPLMTISEEYGLSYKMLRYRHNIGIRDDRILMPNQRGRAFEQI